MGNLRRRFTTIAVLGVFGARILACSSDDTTAPSQNDAGISLLSDSALPALEAGNGSETGAFDGAVSPPDGSADAGTGADGAADAGADAYADADAGKSCKQGTDFEGLCICNKGAFVQPADGTCGATPPGTCSDQGGACTLGSGECPDGGVAGTKTTNLACGDFAPTRCCFATCKGPTDFVCCPTSDAGSPAPRPSICENGYRTCDGDTKPVHGATCPPP